MCRRDDYPPYDEPEPEPVTPADQGREVVVRATGETVVLLSIDMPTRTRAHVRGANGEAVYLVRELRRS